LSEKNRVLTNFKYKIIFLLKNNFIELSRARRAARGGQSSHHATWITSMKQHPDGLAPSCIPAAHSGIRI
jgi:hypothetical protein